MNNFIPDTLNDDGKLIWQNFHVSSVPKRTNTITMPHFAFRNKRPQPNCHALHKLHANIIDCTMWLRSRSFRPILHDCTEHANYSECWKQTGEAFYHLQSTYLCRAFICPSDLDEMACREYPAAALNLFRTNSFNEANASLWNLDIRVELAWPISIETFTT